MAPRKQFFPALVARILSSEVQIQMQENFLIFRKIITLLLYLAWVAAQRHEKRPTKAGKNLQEMVKRSEILAELYLDSGCL